MDCRRLGQCFGETSLHVYRAQRLCEEHTLCASAVAGEVNQPAHFTILGDFLKFYVCSKIGSLEVHKPILGFTCRQDTLPMPCYFEAGSGTEAWIQMRGVAVRRAFHSYLRAYSHIYTVYASRFKVDTSEYNTHFQLHLL